MFLWTQKVKVTVLTLTQKVTLNAKSLYLQLSNICSVFTHCTNGTKLYYIPVSTNKLALNPHLMFTNVYL